MCMKLTCSDVPCSRLVLLLHSCPSENFIYSNCSVDSGAGAARNWEFELGRRSDERGEPAAVAV
jgi:hypothetical protein